MEVAQLTAKLNLLKVRLEQERATWKFHLIAMRKYEDDKHISETHWREDRVAATVSLAPPIGSNHTSCCLI